MKCIAYIRHGRAGNRWIPCTRRATGQSAFCRTHRDAANGVILGLWVKGYLERQVRDLSTRPSAGNAGVRLDSSASAVQ
jgi:hypothetical protein